MDEAQYHRSANDTKSKTFHIQVASGPPVGVSREKIRVYDGNGFASKRTESKHLHSRFSRPSDANVNNDCNTQPENDKRAGENLPSCDHQKQSIESESSRSGLCVLYATIIGDAFSNSAVLLDGIAADDLHNDTPVTRPDNALCIAANEILNELFTEPKKEKVSQMREMSQHSKFLAKTASVNTSSSLEDSRKHGRSSFTYHGAYMSSYNNNSQHSDIATNHSIEALHDDSQRENVGTNHSSVTLRKKASESRSAVKEGTEADIRELKLLQEYLRERSKRLDEMLDEDKIVSRLVTADQVALRRMLNRDGYVAYNQDEDEILENPNYFEELRTLHTGELNYQLLKDMKASGFKKRTLKWLEQILGLEAMSLDESESMHGEKPRYVQRGTRVLTRKRSLEQKAENNDQLMASHAWMPNESVTESEHERCNVTRSGLPSLRARVGTSSWIKNIGDKPPGIDRNIEINISSIIVGGSQVPGHPMGPFLKSITTEPLVHPKKLKDRKIQSNKKFPSEKAKSKLVRLKSINSDRGSNTSAFMRRNCGSLSVVSDLPRIVHTDQQYASWCSRLINCLSFSGKSFVRHEFFYSDIDRPWFDFDSFRADLIKLGISPGVKLTRTEWSLVRQKIQKRPRRFSRKFIDEEMTKLNKYRTVVRGMQQKGSPQPSGFAFDVPRRIKAGAVVTAYNRRFRVLHRGTVLGYDLHRRMYLVQFERKELGFEFCPDTEVASHGAPSFLFSDEIKLRNPPDRFLDHAETSYAPVVIPSAKVQEGPTATLNAGTYYSSAVTSGPFEHRRSENQYEREFAAELLETIDVLIRRENRLLNAAETLNANATTFLRNSATTIPDRFVKCKAWLIQKLEETSQSLDSARSTLQLVYTERIIFWPEASFIRNSPVALSRPTLPSDHFDTDGMSRWVTALLSITPETMPVLDSLLEEALSRGTQGNELKLKHFASRFHSALKLLVCTEMVSKCKTPIGNDAETTSRGILICLKALLEDLKHTAPNIPDDVNTLDVQIRRWVQVMRQLERAVLNLHSEVTALHY